MSNNSHIDKYLTETECLSEQQMLDYADNKLTARERHFAERHMLGCEMCADAVEGFAMISDRSVLDETMFAVGAIAARDEKEEEKKKGFWTLRMRIAASIAILFLAGAVYFLQDNLQQQSKETLAQNLEPNPAEKKSAETKAAENAQPPAPADNETNQLASESQKQEVGTTPTRAEKDENFSSIVSGSAASQSGRAFSAPAAPKASAEMMETDNLAVMDAEEKANERAASAAEPMNDIAFTGNNAGEAEEESIPEPANSKVTTNSVTISGSSSSKSTASFKATDMATMPLSAGNSYTVNTAKKKEEKAAKNARKMDEPASAGAHDDANRDSKEANSKASDETARFSNTGAATGSDTKSAAASTLELAIEKYKAGRYAEATPLFEQALRSEPGNTYALFYSAVNYLGTNDHAKALVNLDKLLAKQGHAFTEQAKWYKAVALVKKGDEKSARSLLEQIVKENGSYAKKAADMLKELK